MNTPNDVQTKASQYAEQWQKWQDTDDAPQPKKLKCFAVDGYEDTSWARVLAEVTSDGQVSMRELYLDAEEGQRVAAFLLDVFRPLATSARCEYPNDNQVSRAAPLGVNIFRWDGRALYVNGFIVASPRVERQETIAWAILLQTGLDTPTPTLVSRFAQDVVARLDLVNGFVMHSDAVERWLREIGGHVPGDARCSCPVNPEAVGGLGGIEHQPECGA